LEAVITAMPKIEIDIPCDVQQEDGSGVAWAFLDEARELSRITEAGSRKPGRRADPGSR